MPLFMDRHDVPGVTAEQVAQAHLADLDMGAKFGVQFLADWFDADQNARKQRDVGPLPQRVRTVSGWPVVAD